MQVYAFGGFQHQQDWATSDSIEEFDPVSKQWAEISPKLNVAR